MQNMERHRGNAGIEKYAASYQGAGDCGRI